jgi:hypothetical protein
MIFRKQKYSSYWYSKTIGQAKIAGGIIENIINEIPHNAQSGYVLVKKIFCSVSYRCLPLLGFEYHNGFK